MKVEIVVTEAMALLIADRLAAGATWKVREVRKYIDGSVNPEHRVLLETEKKVKR